MVAHHARSAAGSTRDDLLAIIRQHRGLHKSELCRMSGRGWGTVGHHVVCLAELGLVETETRGRLLWIFDQSVSARDRDVLAALRPSMARQILEVLGRRSRASTTTLSDELTVSKKVIRHHLVALKRVDAVEELEGHPPTYARIK